MIRSRVCVVKKFLRAFLCSVDCVDGTGRVRWRGREGGRRGAAEEREEGGNIVHELELLNCD